MSAFAKSKKYTEVWDYFGMIDLFKYSDLLASHCYTLDKTLVQLKRLARKNLPPNQFVRNTLCRKFLDLAYTQILSLPSEEQLQHLADIF